MDTTAQPSARNEEPAESGLAGFFHFRERGTDFGTEVRAGLTTFMVMAYILFLNGAILTSGFDAMGKADAH